MRLTLPNKMFEAIDTVVWQAGPRLIRGHGRSRTRVGPNVSKRNLKSQQLTEDERKREDVRGRGIRAGPLKNLWCHPPQMLKGKENNLTRRRAGERRGQRLCAPASSTRGNRTNGAHR